MMRGALLRSFGPSRITLADQARDIGHWEAAACYYREALDKNPDRAPIWVQYGHALKEQGLLEAAEQAYRQALSLDAEAADPHIQLGHVLKLQGRCLEAEECYRQAYRLDPMSPAANAELQAFWPYIADQIRPADDYAIDPDFTAAVYGGTKERRRSLPSAQRAGGERQYRSCQHLLAVHWLAPHILEIFDPLYYYHINDSVSRDVGKFNRHRCLVHFCETGIDKLFQCNDRFRFDPDFYIKTYFDYDVSMPASNAYRHWLNTGYRTGWHPNKGNWIKSVLDIDERIVAEPALALLLGSPEASDKVKWTDRLLALIARDPLEPAYPPIAAETADLFVAIAHRFAAQDEDLKALRLYDRVLHCHPTHMRAAEHRADCLLRTGSLLEASRAHGEILAADDRKVGSYLSLAACCEGLGDLFSAVATLNRGMSLHPGDMQLRRKFETASDQLILSEWHHVAFPLAVSGRFEDARARIKRASEAITSLLSSEPRLPNRPIRSLAIITSGILHQCRLYRVDQKVEQLLTAGYDVHVYQEGMIGEYLQDIFRYDAAIFCRVPGTASMLRAVSESNRAGVITFYEVDDLIFSDEFPDEFSSYRDLITVAEYAGLKLGAPLYRGVISLCDYAIASTTPLAEKLAELVSKRRAFVHRNAFGSLHASIAARQLEPRSGDQVVIFYGSGTKAHKKDFQDLVEPALVELVRRHRERIVIVLAGYTAPSERLEAIRGNLRFHDVDWDIERYWALLAEADINIAALSPSLNADCKSEIKWMEAAMFGVPSVVSGTRTYREVVEDGVTGLICNTPEDWTAALDRLVRDRALRRRIGEAAWRHVCKAYSIEAAAKNLRTIFDAVSPLVEVPAKPVVLVVNVYYPPQAFGGATRVVHDNVRYLASEHADDFQIAVFTTIQDGGPQYRLSTYVQDGVQVTGINRDSVPEVEYAVTDERVGEIFESLLDRLRPALIHFHCIQRLTVSVVAAAQRRGIPYLITAHDAWWISSHQFAIDVHNELRLYDYDDPLATLKQLSKPEYDRMKALKEPLLGAEHVIAVSSQFADLYRSRGVHNTIAVENGVSNLAERRRTRSASGRVRLAFLGSMGGIKGYDLIKCAFLSQRFRHLHLIVMDGGMRSGESRSADWNGTPVEFFAKVPEEQVGELYAKIDVLLAPSIWPESFGLVTREALHFGCWVVASDRGAIAGCVTEGVNGHIIDVSDASGLIAVLKRIDDSPERYLNSPPTVPQMRGADEQGAELAAIYKRIIAGSRDLAACRPAGNNARRDVDYADVGRAAG